MPEGEPQLEQNTDVQPKTEQPEPVAPVGETDVLDEDDDFEDFTNEGLFFAFAFLVYLLPQLLLKHVVNLIADQFFFFFFFPLLLIRLLNFLVGDNDDGPGYEKVEWEDNWDDEVEGENDFVKRLRAELEKHTS